MLAIEVKTDFHPVGQGLFATGSLRRHSTTRPVFRWVYDCGTTSEQQYVRRAITRLEGEWNWPEGPTRRIDMFVLSHFDHDHLSGLTTLLSKFSIGTLVLPYVRCGTASSSPSTKGSRQRTRNRAFSSTPPIT